MIQNNQEEIFEIGDAVQTEELNIDTIAGVFIVPAMKGKITDIESHYYAELDATLTIFIVEGINIETGEPLKQRYNPFYRKGLVKRGL